MLFLLRFVGVVVPSGAVQLTNPSFCTAKKGQKIVKTIRFNRAYDVYIGGDVAAFDNFVADNIVGKGYASFYDKDRDEQHGSFGPEGPPPLSASKDDGKNVGDSAGGVPHLSVAAGVAPNTTVAAAMKTPGKDDADPVKPGIVPGVNPAGSAPAIPANRGGAAAHAGAVEAGTDVNQTEQTRETADKNPASKTGPVSDGSPNDKMVSGDDKDVTKK